MIGWFASAIAAEAKRIVENRQVSRANIRLVESLAQFRASAADVTAYTAKLQELIPTKEKLIGFPELLEARAAVRGASARITFTGGGTETDGGVAVAAFTLTVSGPRESIVAFLDEIERTSPNFLIRLGGLRVFRSGTVYEVATTGQVLYRTE